MITPKKLGESIIMNNIYDVPLEIIGAVNEIDIYFRKLGINEWELGHVCSRNYAHRLKYIEKIN
jgi:hypothetical protein